jgi:large subunit ribosomal protein L15
MVSFWSNFFISSRNASSSTKLLQLNDFPVSGLKTRKRVGRGTGSGLGKMSGRGHQKARSVPRGYEGGQTPLYKRLPKIGFVSHTFNDMATISLSQLQDMIDMKRLVLPRSSTTDSDQLITIRDMHACGALNRVGKSGLKLLNVDGNGTQLSSSVHLEVQQASKSAIATVESNGGTVTCVYLNKLAVRALLKPFKFKILPVRSII